MRLAILFPLLLFCFVGVCMAQGTSPVTSAPPSLTLPTADPKPPVVTDWAVVVDKIGQYLVTIVTMILAFLTKLDAAKTKSLAENTAKEVEKSRQEARSDINSQTQVLLSLNPKPPVVGQPPAAM